MNTTRNEGIAELRERTVTPALVNMERLETDLGRVPAPPISPDNLAKRAQPAGMSRPSPLQSIADAIKRLVWDDNENLAQLITEHYGDGSKGSMAAAVQRAADDLMAATKDQ
jgi:hypothetical protein